MGLRCRRSPPTSPRLAEPATNRKPISSSSLARSTRPETQRLYTMEVLLSTAQRTSKMTGTSSCVWHTFGCQPHLGEQHSRS